MTQHQLSKLIDLFNFFKPKEFHHGDCIGADDEAFYVYRMWCRPKDPNVVLHPPVLWRLRARTPAKIKRPARPYLDRNRDIVRECSVLIACPKEEEGEEIRSGTWYTVRYARTLHRPIYIIRPSGKVELENV